jgi:hypothetical protein
VTVYPPPDRIVLDLGPPAGALTEVRRAAFLMRDALAARPHIATRSPSSAASSTGARACTGPDPPHRRSL